MSPPLPRVLQIGTTDRHGGAATVARLLHDGLARRGAAPRMLVGLRRSDDPAVRGIFERPGSARRANVPLGHRLRRRAARWLPDELLMLPRRAWKAAPELADADLVHAHNLHGQIFDLRALADLSRRRPLVWTLHDMWAMTCGWVHAFDCPHWPTGPCDCRPPNSLIEARWRRRGRQWRRRRDTYRRSSLTLVAPSAWMASRVEEGMLSGHPVTVIPNGVDVARFPPRDRRSARDELDLPAEARLILFVGKGGAANPWKGWSHAAAVAERLSTATGSRPRLRAVFVGGGPTPAPGIDLGLVRDANRMATVYAACDLLLYPSLADNCPLSVIEAMASGLPIAGFATGGVPELVRDGIDGALVPTGDTAALGRAVSALVEQPATLAEMSAAARARALADFSSERMLERYLRLYSRTIEAAERGVTSRKA